MRKILWSLVIIGILILTPDLVCYASGPGTTTASFLKIGVGARAAAMGEAFTAVASDGTSLYWNPDRSSFQVKSFNSGGRCSQASG